MTKSLSRRKLIRSAVGGMVAAGAPSTGRKAAAQKAASIAGFDHVALPMQNVDAMLNFYRGLGRLGSHVQVAISPISAS